MLLWRIIKVSGAAIGFAGTWFGFLFFPKDMSETGQALQSWRDLMPIDRETAFIMFSGICVLYIIGRDFYHDLLPLFAHRVGLWKDERMSFSEFVDFVEKKYGWKIRGGPSTYECMDVVDALATRRQTGKSQYTVAEIQTVTSICAINHLYKSTSLTG